MWHVMRHNMHHALSSSVAERALRIRLLQLCLTSGELAVLLCLMIAGDASIVVSVTCPQTRPLTHTATATVAAGAPWRPVRTCAYHLKRLSPTPLYYPLLSAACTKSTILPLVGPRLTVNDWLPSVVSVTDA